MAWDTPRPGQDVFVIQFKPGSPMGGRVGHTQCLPSRLDWHRDHVESFLLSHLHNSQGINFQMQMKFAELFQEP